MPFDALTAIDYVIIVSVSAVLGFLLGQWRDLALAWLVGLVAHVFAHALFLMIGGASLFPALAASATMYVGRPGDELILRAALYAAAIAIVFALKTLYQRR